MPATTKSNAECSNAIGPGLSKYMPSWYPTRAPAIGPSNGMPEIDKAAEAPIIARISAGTSGFNDITVAIICTSFIKFSGNNGRNGRSIKRERKVSSSLKRPSLLLNPPGILPAA